MHIVYLYPVRPDLMSFDAKVMFIARHDFLYLGRDHPHLMSQPEGIDSLGATQNPWYRVEGDCVYATGNHPDGTGVEPHYRRAVISMGEYKFGGLVAAEGQRSLKPGTPAFVIR